MNRSTIFVGFFVTALFTTGCSREVIEPHVTDKDPPELAFHNVTPSAGPFVRDSEGSASPVKFPLIGLTDPVKEELIPFVAYQSLWVLEDGKAVDIEVKDLGGSGAPSAIDMVFVIDNSGSMGEEADRIAEGILSYSAALASAGWDIRFGCVGQDGTINGGIGLTTTSDFSAYLTRPNRQGTARTRGISDPNASAIAAWATQNQLYGENGVLGVRCAEETFAWRPDAVRVFINFTDEPIQSPSTTDLWTTNRYCNEWTPARGTIHTVWSGDPLVNESWLPGLDDNPADLSDCTGGKTLEIASDASDLALAQLPFVSELQASVTVSFDSANPEASHTVEIIVQNGSTADGNVVLPDITYR